MSYQNTKEVKPLALDGFPDFTYSINFILKLTNQDIKQAFNKQSLSYHIHDKFYKLVYNIKIYNLYL